MDGARTVARKHPNAVTETKHMNIPTTDTRDMTQPS